MKIQVLQADGLYQKRDFYSMSQLPLILQVFS